MRLQTVLESKSFKADLTLKLFDVVMLNLKKIVINLIPFTLKAITNLNMFEQRRRA